MTWVLIICTSGWGMCGAIIEYQFPDERTCQAALEQVKQSSNDSGIKYALCKPKDQQP